MTLPAEPTDRMLPALANERMLPADPTLRMLPTDADRQQALRREGAELGVAGSDRQDRIDRVERGDPPPESGSAVSTVRVRARPRR